VTKLNDTRFAVNPDLIERISTEPDTTITMVGGVKYVVLEPLGDVIDLVAQFRARVLAEAYERRGISSIEADGN
jgi:flagellar protein FlbD